MRRSSIGVAAVVIAACFAGLAQATTATARPARSPVLPPPRAPRIAQAYTRLRLAFQPNRGQLDRRVQFLARATRYTVMLTSGGPVLVLGKAHAAAFVDLRFVGAHMPARAHAERELPGKVNYLIGNDRRQWRLGIATFARVVYSNLYPGVDVAYHGRDGVLEYDLQLHAGANPRLLALRLAGPARLRLNARGQLILRLRGGVLRMPQPYAYQQVGSARRQVSARYRIAPDETIRFQIGRYDRARPLVIDPVLVYATYLGGSNTDQILGVAVGGDGSAYVTGTTASDRFPATGRTSPDGWYQAFVTKLNPSGTAAEYSTYVGTDSRAGDKGTGIAVDAAGDAYITGQTCAGNQMWPTTPGAFTTPWRGCEVFAAELNPSGTGLVYGARFGGGSNGEYHDAEAGQAVAVDRAGDTWITGWTQSSDFPVTAGAAQPTLGGGTDAFVTELSPTGALRYSTFLGGSSSDDGYGIGVDGAGNAYVTGATDSSNFPTRAAVQPSPGGGENAFVAKITSTGALAYSTYLGGGGRTDGRAIAVDSAGDAYVTGFAGFGFPTTAGAYQTGFAGGNDDAFVTKLNPGGSAVVYSTLLGGSPDWYGYYGDDAAYGIAVDAAGDAYVTGQTSSANFPTVNAFDAGRWGPSDVFVSELDPAGSGLVYSTYLGGSADDAGYGIAVDRAGNAYVGGTTCSTDFPASAGALQSSGGVNCDGFVAKVGSLDSTPPVLSGIPGDTTISATSSSGAVFTWNASAGDPDDAVASFACDPPSGSTFPLGTTTVTCSATDTHGNTATATFTVTVVDTTPPTVRCTAPDATVWYAADVTVACTAGDGESGLANSADATFSLSTSVASGTETSAAATDDRSVCDKAGNCSAAGPYTFMVDERPPTVTCDASPVFTLGQTGAVVTATVTDGGSGPQSATVSAAADTSSAGAKTVSLAAADNVGNRTTVSCPYQVDYAFSGFLAPVSGPPSINVAKAGRTYPLKWQLTDAAGTFVSALSAVTRIVMQPTSCTDFATAPTSALATETRGSSGLRYEDSANQYVYNWATPASGCYTVFLELDSGQILSALFRLS